MKSKKVKHEYVWHIFSVETAIDPITWFLVFSRWTYKSETSNDVPSQHWQHDKCAPRSNHASWVHPGPWSVQQYSFLIITSHGHNFDVWNQLNSMKAPVDHGFLYKRLSQFGRIFFLSYSPRNYDVPLKGAISKGKACLSTTTPWKIDMEIMEPNHHPCV